MLGRSQVPDEKSTIDEKWPIMYDDAVLYLDKLANLSFINIMNIMNKCWLQGCFVVYKILCKIGFLGILGTVALLSSALCLMESRLVCRFYCNWKNFTAIPMPTPRNPTTALFLKHILMDCTGQRFRIFVWTALLNFPWRVLTLFMLILVGTHCLSHLN